MGIFLVLLAIVMFGPFGLSVGAHVHATFLLSAPPATGVSPLTMPVRWVSVPLAIVCAALGATLVARTPAARHLRPVRPGCRRSSCGRS